MSVSLVPGRVPASSGQGHPNGRLASRAVGLSAVSAAAFAGSIATTAIAYAAGRESAIEDNWLGVLLVTVASVGLLGSLAAFMLAIIARVRREPWVLLWLPLSVFPACVLFVAFGEAFWWE